MEGITRQKTPKNQNKNNKRNNQDTIMKPSKHLVVFVTRQVLSLISRKECQCLTLSTEGDKGKHMSTGDLISVHI